jgi:3-hydroxy-5-methyl-1-naphthoate 3-O-methyltransferase
MELATGFWSFKTLASAYELGLFEQLSGTSGTTAGELAGRLGIAERPSEMLLTGCAALGLLDAQGGRYVNSALSDEYLVPGRPNHFGGLVTMFDRRLYGGLVRADPGHPDQPADDVGPRRAAVDLRQRGS